MPYNSQSFVPQQPIRQVYDPINFGILNAAGQGMEAKKGAALNELDSLNALLKVKTIPGSQDEKNVRSAEQKLHEITYKASSDNLYDPVVAREYIKQARQVVSNPAFAGYENEWGKWAAGMKRKQEAAAKPDAADPAMQWNFDKSVSEYNKPGGGFDAGKSIQGHDFEFSVNPDTEIQKVFADLKASGSETTQKLKDLDELYYKHGWEGISNDRVRATAGDAIDLLKQSTAGRQLQNDYAMAKDQGHLPVNRQTGEPLSEDQYLAENMLKVGRRFVWGKTTSNEAEIKNAGLKNRQAKLANITLEPALSTSAKGQNIPWGNVNEFNKYSNETLPTRINALKTLKQEVQANKGVLGQDQLDELVSLGVDQSDVDKLKTLKGSELNTELDSQLAKSDAEVRNVNDVYFKISQMPGDWASNFEKVSQEKSFRGAEQSLPRGKNDIIVDQNKFARQSAAKELETKGIISMANDVSILDEEGKPIDKGDNLNTLREGKLNIKSLYFDKDQNPILKVGVLIPKAGTSPAVEKQYEIKNVPADHLLKIANDYKTLADNYRYAAQNETGDQAHRDLNEARDHEKAATMVTHRAVSSYINQTTSKLPSNSKKVVFDLGAIGVPGKKVEATRDGDYYTTPYGTFKADGLIQWFSDIVDQSNTK